MTASIGGSFLGTAGVLVAAGVLVLGCPGEAPGQVVEVVHSFDLVNGAQPQSGLARDAEGNFYGTTQYGGTGSCYGYCGTVFTLTPAGGFTKLHDFSPDGGHYPIAGLLLASDGDLYGTTARGGSAACPGGCGTVFRITRAGSLTVLHTFVGTDGMWPRGRLVEGSDGALYGTTERGGLEGGTTSSAGTIYRITTGGAFTSLHKFGAIPQGRNPIAGLRLAGDGALYGTTVYGGSASGGTVFRITADGTLTYLHTFTGPDGRYPAAAPIEDPGGWFYGSTAAGGTADLGTIYRMTPAGAVTTLHHFTAAGGYLPWDELLRLTDGTLYGTTELNGGPVAHGTIFRIPPGGALTTLHTFAGADGSRPRAGLIEGLDGHLYGTTAEGGASARGVVYRVVLVAANLRVTTVKAPAGAAPGATITVTDTTRNDGPGRADPSHTAIWLSTNKTLGGDTLLATRAVPTLAAAAVSTRATSVALPTVAPGVYYLIAQADTDGEVAETSESDNVKAKTLTVGPDLVATMAFTPPVPTSTTPTTIAVTTKNVGGDTAGASVTRLYRSADAKIGVGDVRLAEWPVAALPPKGTQSDAVTVTLPAGTYYLIAQVDAVNTVVEARETNNLKKVKKTVP